MSMSNWTVEGYGIDSEVLNDTNFGDYRVLAKKFAELHPEEIGNYIMNNREKTPCKTADDLADLMIEEPECFNDYYLDKYGYPHGTGVIGDLVNKWFDSHGYKGAGTYLNYAGNDDDDLGIMMGAVYPFAADRNDEAYKAYMGLTLDTIESAFRWALSELGYTMKNSDFGFVSVEMWG